MFLDRLRMRALNQRFLKHGHDTDVIAFSYETETCPPGYSPPRGGGELLPFGDIYISAFLARRQALKLGHGVLTEVLTLVTHGALHLIGYDDSTPRKRTAMFQRQETLLNDIISP